MPDGYQVGRAAARDRSQAVSAVEKLRRALGTLADVRAPHEAEEPILAPAVRGALFTWLREINARSELERVGVKPRTTAMLFGPPGTGKTTLAHHLAGRLGIPMVVVGPENIIGSYLGESSKNAAKLFDAMREVAVPCLLFIDEIDSLGANREGSRGTSADRELVSTLTVFMRKIEEYSGFCIGATNRKDAIDPALWRRFHIQLSVDLPGYDERWAIIKRYSLPFALADEDIDMLADVTDRASPALLRTLMEGMKRALVVNPRAGRSIEKPSDVLLPVLLSIEPPPGLDKPPLWLNSNAEHLFNSMASWPPTIIDSESSEGK